MDARLALSPPLLQDKGSYELFLVGENGRQAGSLPFTPTSNTRCVPSSPRKVCNGVFWYNCFSFVLF